MSIKCFAELKQKALEINEQLKVVGIWPDVETIKTAEQAKNIGLADFTFVFHEKIPGFPTIVVPNPQIALETGIDLVIRNEVDTLMKGLVNTSLFLKVLIKSKLIKGWVSHTSVLEIPNLDKLIIVTDGTVTPNPSIEQKIEIIKNAVLCAKVLGITIPKVALLSANEWITPNLSSTYDAALITKMFERGQIECEALVDGPVSVDLALSEKSALKKRVTLRFDPPADILMAPDLESAAFLIKSAVYMGKVSVAGALWGMVSPVVLTSRSDNCESRVISLCIAKIARRVIDS